MAATSALPPPVSPEVFHPGLLARTIASSNYSTGDIISKASSIEGIQENSLQPPANGKQYEAAPARDAHGRLVVILHEDTSGAVFVGDKKGLTPLAKSSVTVDSTGQPT